MTTQAYVLRSISPPLPIQRSRAFRFKLATHFDVAMPAESWCRRSGSNGFERLRCARSCPWVLPREALQPGPSPGSWFGGRRRTHCTRFAPCVQTGGAKSEVDARGARAPSCCAAQPLTNRPATARAAVHLHRERRASSPCQTHASKLARPADGRFVRGRGRSEAGQARAARINNGLGGTCLTAVSAANEGSLPPLTCAVSTEGSRLARADPGTMSTAAGRVD